MSPDWLSLEDRERALRYLEESFGIPALVFANHRLLRRGEFVWAVRRGADAACGVFPHEQAGLKLLKLVGRGRFKPTSQGMQVFGREATRGVVELGDDDLKGLISGRSLPWSGEPGPVILRWQGLPVGMGVGRGTQLTSQLPRAVTETLRL